ncbi:MAG: type IX secretion system membrane protein PorP/SprF [Flavobacteriaceae bacterium]
MKKLFFLFLIALGSVKIMAQQAPQFTQYMYNTMVINPAYAGSRGVFSIGALYRSQWIGLDGAPTTQTLTINTPASESVGLGFSIVNDEIGNGTNQNTYFDATFSYTLTTSETGNLSLGLKAGGHLLSLDFSKLINYGAESNLPNVDKKFSPNFGAGIYYHTNNFFAGFSVPNFLETKHFDNSDQSNSYLAKNRMNYYLISGYVFDLNPTLKFRPTILFKAVTGAPVQVDLSAGFLFNDVFSVAAAYRLNATASALAGFQVSTNFMIGLSYDRETTSLGTTNFNDGSLEIFLRYDFVNRFNRRSFNKRFF